MVGGGWCSASDRMGSMVGEIVEIELLVCWVDMTTASVIVFK